MLAALGAAWLWRGPWGGVPGRRGPCRGQLPGWHPAGTAVRRAPPGAAPAQSPFRARDTGQSLPCGGRSAPGLKVSGSTSALSCQSLGEKQIRKPFPEIASRERRPSGLLTSARPPGVAQGGRPGAIGLVRTVSQTQTDHAAGRPQELLTLRETELGARVPQGHPGPDRHLFVCLPAVLVYGAMGSRRRPGQGRHGGALPGFQAETTLLGAGVRKTHPGTAPWDTGSLGCVSGGLCPGPAQRPGGSAEPVSVGT